jgi:hypothetical protein
MALREFIAPDGEQWRVWQVIPTLGRSGFARLRERRTKDAAPYEGADRRKGDRRSPGSQTPVLAAGLEGGWLAFEHSAAWPRRPPGGKAAPTRSSARSGRPPASSPRSSAHPEPRAAAVRNWGHWCVLLRLARLRAFRRTHHAAHPGPPHPRAGPPPSMRNPE